VGRAWLGCLAVPNNRLQPTPSSLRSCVAPASRRGSPLALGACGARSKTAEDTARVRRLFPTWAGVAPRQKAPPYEGRGSPNAGRGAAGVHDPGSPRAGRQTRAGRREPEARPCVPSDRRAPGEAGPSSPVVRGASPCRQRGGASVAPGLGLLRRAAPVGGRVRGSQECVALVGRSWRDTAGGGRRRAPRRCPAPGPRCAAGVSGQAVGS